MYLDALTATALADELTLNLAGAKVQNVVQPDRLSIAFELFAQGRRHYLTLTADAGREGFLLSAEKVRRGEGAPTPLLLALRSRVEGGRLAAVQQPPFERILHFRFQGEAEHTLVAELTGRLANLILLDANGVVLALARPVTAKMTAARVVLPRQPYQAPPVPDKSAPDQVTAADIGRWLAEEPEAQAWSVLVRHVLGISPLAGREIAARAGDDEERAPGPAGETIQSAAAGIASTASPDPGLAQPAGSARDSGSAQPDESNEPPSRPPTSASHVTSPGSAKILASAADPDRLLAALRDVTAGLATHAWSPCVVYVEDGIAAYAPYELTHRPGAEPTSSIAEAIARFEAQRVAAVLAPAGRQAPAGGSDPYLDARLAVARRIAEAEEKLRRKLGALDREAARETDLEALREAGDLIHTFQRQIVPGQALLDAGFDSTQPPRSIRLDPALSPAENARAYFDRYGRAKRAAQALPARRAEVVAGLATLDQLATDLAMAENRAGIDAVHDELGETGHLRRPQKKRTHGGGGPLQVLSPDGLLILVGRNSRQNELVTFKHAVRNDLWLHAHGMPGAHVVVKCAGRPVPDRTLQEAAELAAWFSRGRGETSVPVSVTEARHVRRLVGGGQGMVTLTQATTLHVQPRPPEAGSGQ